MQLIEACNEVMDEMGLARASPVIGSADPNSRKLAACAQRALQDLWRAHNWSVLHREYEFTTESGNNNYQVPADFGRQVTDTAWDRTSYWRVRGGLTPGDWQSRKSGFALSSAGRFSFRALIGDRQASILLDPTPSAANDLVIEYISRYVVENTSQEPFEKFESDFHHIRLDGELFLLGLTWRARRAFGNPYSEDYALYAAKLQNAVANDLRIYSTVNSDGLGYDLPYPNIPDGNWPGS